MQSTASSVDVAEFYGQLHETIRTSDSIAYRHYEERYSYAEMYDCLLKINSVLAGRRNQQIVTYVDKSFSAYCAIYSVFLSGNTWIPLNTEMPDARLADILSQLDPSLVLCNIPISEGVKAHLAQRGIEWLDVGQVIQEEDRADFGSFSFEKDEIAYIMFTSGSTGMPKGVPMTHENYLNFIRNSTRIMEFRKGDVFADYHEFAFDISIFYLFCCPISEGAIAPVRNSQDRLMPLSFIQKNEVTVWASVPSAISLLQTFQPDGVIDSKLRILFICGEPFSLKVLAYCLSNLRGKHVYNFYGLTETGVENFWHECSATDLEAYEPYGYVPIGRPLDGNRISVSDEKELLLSGCQITPGYLSGVGEESFEVVDGIRWFHTGDVVEEHAGVYFCKGRLDSQVKVRGYRIELMDIEVHMKRYEGVDEAVCFVQEGRNKNILVGAVKPRPGQDLDVQGLREYLMAHLPVYMAVSKIHILDALPANPNGKIDRRKIREMLTA